MLIKVAELTGNWAIFRLTVNISIIWDSYNGQIMWNNQSKSPTNTVNSQSQMPTNTIVNKLLSSEVSIISWTETLWSKLDYDKTFQMSISISVSVSIYLVHKSSTLWHNFYQIFWQLTRLSIHTYWPSTVSSVLFFYSSRATFLT